MNSKVNFFIKENNMLDCANLIVGLSGGADSICLISILQDYIKDNNLDINLVAVHVNHGIRENATRDENFVKSFCKKRTIKLIVEKIDCIAIAKELSLTVEEAGRYKRYEIFEELASKLEKEKGKTRIAVAHHMNDQAETVLMNIARGTSFKGLRGIKPVRDRIIRPLLCLKRSEIEDYIKENSLDYVVDETNFDNEYTRNAIRNIVIPCFEDKVNSNFVENLSAMATRMQLVEDFIENTTKKAWEKVVVIESDIFKINIEELKKLEELIANNIIYKVLSLAAKAKKDIYEVNVREVYKLLELETGKEISLPYELIAKKSYDYIIVKKRHTLEATINNQKNVQEDYKIHLNKKDIKEGVIVNWPGLVYYKNELIKIKGIKFSLVDNKISIKDYESDYAKCFDYDKIKSPIDIRYREIGDYIVVDALGHSHKLKKEFINRKILSEMRKSCLLICQESECLWAFGIRRSLQALVDDNTRNVLIVEILL